jgi:hypothetical protein
MKEKARAVILKMEKDYPKTFKVIDIVSGVLPYLVFGHLIALNVALVAEKRFASSSPT